ncbi:MAG: sigma-54 dependent transcriptional regulator [Chitinispirillaceae bacterium]|jgi:DNA-binding NtrC family response regulator|nr:sigma-54 dependent transcriptional regulator [Chitinispirillaceae bacterium]
MNLRVLIVDDEVKQRNLLAGIIGAEKSAVVFQAGSVEEALTIIKTEEPQVVLSDLKLPGRTGLSLLDDIEPLPLPPEVIIITGFASIETAVRATKLGAYDYLTKPVQPLKLLFLIDKAKEKYDLREERFRLQQELTNKIGRFMIAESAVMKSLLGTIESVAVTDATVLIRGETGTGKELVASIIHLRSRRAGKPMQSINCSAFVDTLFDAELFGYEKGSFTGAQTQKKGIVESAHGGTLFLDEIGDLSQSSQAKILRTLQERTIRRVGGREDIPVDIRIIAATNLDLEHAIRTGSFREDLFYRLNIIPIVVPPLREHREDIPALAGFFLAKTASGKVIGPEALDALVKHNWPGNVRELKSCIERAALFCTGSAITKKDLFPNTTINEEPARTLFDIPDEGLVFEEVERKLISQALEKSRGNMVAAAKLLGMNYRAFRYRAKSFGLI